MDSERPAPAYGSFRIGSDTKTFVSVVLLQLVGEGRIGLSHPSCLDDVGVLIYLSRLAVKARQRQQARERAQTTYPPVASPCGGPGDSLDTFPRGT